MALRHQDAPALLHLHADKVVLPDVHRFQKEREIQKAAVKLLAEMIGAVRVYIETDSRMKRAEFTDELRKNLRRHEPAGSDRNDAGQFFPCLEFHADLVDDLRHFLRASAKKHARIRQLQVLAADEKLRPQLLLQRRHLTGQRRLRQMQQLRRSGNILLPDHRQEMIQYLDIHTIPPYLISIIRFLYGFSKCIKKE